MNNQQAGQLRETIEKEGRSKQRWFQQYGRDFGITASMMGDGFEPEIPDGRSRKNAGYKYMPNRTQSRNTSRRPQNNNNNNYDSRYRPSSARRSGPSYDNYGGGPNYDSYAPRHSAAPRHSTAPRRSSPQPAQPADAYGANIYDNAIRVSSPRMAADQDEEDVPRTVTKKVVRQVEVPYKRQVKVPVKTKKLVPHRVHKKVKKKKLVEVPVTREREEKYMDVQSVESTRNKEVWVKKIVPEKYMKQVEVERTRMVPYTDMSIREVEDWETVSVTENRVVEVDGFRVDEVEDSKLVEVEEFQTFELKPHATGEAQVVGTREIGHVNNSRAARKIGNVVHHTSSHRVRDIDEDSQPDDVPRRSAPPRQRAMASNRSRVHFGSSRGGPPSHRSYRSGTPISGSRY